MTLLVWSLVEEVLVPGHLMLHYWVRLTHSGYQPVTLAPVAPVAHSLHEVEGGQYVSSIPHRYHPEPHRRKQALSVINATGYPMVTLGRKIPGRHNPDEQRSTGAHKSCSTFVATICHVAYDFSDALKTHLNLLRVCCPLN